MRGPEIFRFRGARSGRLASAAVRASGRPWVEEVGLGSLGADGPAVVWLASGPGSLAQADLCVATAVLLERPWTVVLTDRCVDAGHPPNNGATGQTDDQPLLTPTRVHIPDLPPITTLFAQGRLTEASAAADLLPEHEQESWRFLELLRLNMQGRSAEVLSRGPMWAEAPCRAEVLGELSRAALRLDLEDRAHRMLLAAQAAPFCLRTTPADLAHARARLAVLRGHLEPESVPEPGTPWRQAFYRARRGLPLPTLAPDLDVLLAEHRKPDPPLSLAHIALEHGHPHLAAWLISDLASVSKSLYEPTGSLRRRLRETRRALVDSDPERASSLLDPLRGDFEGRHDSWATLVNTCDMVIAAARGERALVHQLAVRLRTCERGRGTTELAEELWPLLFEMQDVWSATTVAEELIELLGSPSDRMQALQRLPDVPVTLGPYELIQPIAEGGMGEVWEARHAASGASFAIKLLTGDAPSETTIAAFRHEVELLTRLDHPAIVAVYDHGLVPAISAVQSRGRVQSGQPYVVMELLPAGTLVSRLGSMATSEILDVALALLDALAYAHAKGVLHRDIKPSNVLLASDGTVRLTDFGLSALPRRGTRAGTPPWMAPEQFTGGEIGPATDLYGLGCLVWAMVTGAPPWMGRVEDLARAHVQAPLPVFDPLVPTPTGLRTWLHRLLKKNASQRYPSALRAAYRLTSLVDAHPALIEPTDPVFLPQTSSPTFTLTELLDLELPPAGLQETATLTEEGTTGFDRRRHWRPRLPTSRMLHRGDPPVLGHDAAKNLLWTLVMRAAAGSPQRVELVGHPGSGRRTLVEWLTMKAQLSGLFEGPLTVVDAGEDAVDAHPVLAGESKLVIWTRPPIRGTLARRIELDRLSSLTLFQVVRSRLLLSPHIAALAALRAVGRPGLALALVEDWMDRPGVGPGPDGLQPLGALPGDARRARAAWQVFMRQLRPADHELVARTCALLPRFHVETWERLRDQIPGTTLPLEAIAYVRYGVYTVPPELAGSIEATPALHQQLANLSHAEMDAGLRHAYHRHLGEDPEAFEALTQALLQISTVRRVPLDVLDTIEAGLDVRLVPGDTQLRMRIRTLRLAFSTGDLRWRRLRTLAARRAGTLPRSAALTHEASMAWLAGWDYGENSDPLTPTDRALVGRLLGRLGKDPLRVTLGIAVGRALWAGGDPERAKRWIRRQLVIAERLDNPDDQLVGLCALSWLTADPEPLIAWVGQASPWAEAFRCTVLASMCLETDPENAMSWARQAVQTPDHPPGASANLAAVLLARRHIGEAHRVVSQGLTEALATQEAVTAGSYQVLLLALTLDGPRPEWEDMLRLAGSGRDFAPVVLSWLDENPQTERTDALRALLTEPSTTA